jgi:hypothetical protein
MTEARALFVADGSSDEPLAGIVERLFLDHDVVVDMTTPEWGALTERVPRDVGSRVRAGLALMSPPPDLLVIHRDAESREAGPRFTEIAEAVAATSASTPHVPIIPVRMTEAWLLLDEAAIRRVSGNPNGRAPLSLPAPAAAERLPDPKALLDECLCIASGMRGRRLRAVRQAFPANRRRLLETLDLEGPIASLPSWQRMQADVAAVAESLR